MARYGGTNSRAFARADRMHETLSYNIDREGGAFRSRRHTDVRTKLPAGRSIDLQKQLEAHQSAFIQIAERVTIFGANPEELQQLETLRRDISLLERDIKERSNA